MTARDVFALPLCVPVEPCCGVLVGEHHDCPQFQADWMAAQADPIVLPAHADVPCLTDPALDGYAPPLRWDVTDTGVEAGL